ncbi:uncharacterized protein LOC117783659 [Drosophila innubila]|uniref:uncharacterized protein LOC117783659 n=1 Tax=Drosophila innubila TaxID=198719 RepID=UPI00148BCB97|nr:uncharacterized protein LOC117783659 [Drosophila innubila]
MKRERIASLALNLGLIISICVAVSAAPRPHSTAQNEDIVMVEDIVSVNPEKNGDTSVALVTLSESNSSQEESDSSSKEDTVSDDLIFLTHKTQTQTQSPTHIDASASEELEEVTVPIPAISVATPIDMSPFIALIPTRQVQQIVSNYYRNDAEVQRAYGFLNSAYFAQKKQQLIQLPEVLAFTRYLNASGLDVLKLVTNVMQTIGPPSTDLPLTEEDNSSSACNELTLPVDNLEANTTTEQVKGLQGLVDSVLDALPQDQILATFFDKIEADQQFSKLIDSIGTPKFSKILSNLQNSAPLRSLLAELQNCRINIAQIVESLKSYFFLSSF